MRLRVLSCVTLAAALWAQTDSLPAPALIAPADGVELHNMPREVWLEWSVVPRAESYTIEIDCEHCCVQGRFCSEVDQSRVFRAAGLQGTRYRFEWWGDQRGRWRVWASAGFIEGEKTPWRMLSFRTDGTPASPASPRTIAPAGNAILPPDPAEVTFEWSPVVGARSYTLEIDPQNTCAEYKFCSDAGVYRIIENIADTRYTASFPSKLWTRWRVWAVAGDRTSLKSPWTMFQHSSLVTGLASGTAAPVNRTTPEYSAAAKAAGLEGVATVYFETGAPGATRNVKILQGLGMGLDEKAVELVRGWRFDPGAPPVQAAEISFRLNGASGWRVRRTAYTVVHENRNDIEGSKPVLRTYVPPDAASCPAGGRTLVELSFDIGKNGLPGNFKAGGPGVVDSALRNAVLAWKFNPAMMQGRERVARARFEMECGASDPHDLPGPAGAKTTTRPSVLFRTDPDYSQEARRAKYNGSVAITVMVDADGFATNLREAQPIGLGLDEKAMEAVLQWRFRPATRDGQAVAVPATVEISFRIL